MTKKKKKSKALGFLPTMKKPPPTSTYGSEFVAARTATEQIINIRLQFRYLGAPVAPTTYLFGDNASVVQSASIPHSRLSKRHVALSYHCVREAIAAGLIKFGHIPGDENLQTSSVNTGDIPKYGPCFSPSCFMKVIRSIPFTRRHGKVILRQDRVSIPLHIFLTLIPQDEGEL